MSKQYIMKDLGYKRTATEAQYIVEMPDGSEWAVPVQAIVDSRDEHYKEDQEDTIGFIREGGLSDYEITDWAGNNMDWDEVACFAKQVQRKTQEVDYQEGWCNGEKRIEGKL